MVQTPHTVRVFDDDLDELRAGVSELGGRVEAAIGAAVGALVQGDEERAREVIDGDSRVDAIAARIERGAICIIALRHPLADDLRDVLAALKIANSIARMGDCAVNVARRVPLLRDCRHPELMRIFGATGEAVAGTVTAALDAFVARDAESALAVRDREIEVDELYAGLFRELVRHMSANPQDIGPGMHLLFAGQKLERIADHARIIADLVHFAATGSRMPPSVAAGPTGAEAGAA